jgi:hypothetical protein
MAVITNHEAKEVRDANASGRTPVVFVQRRGTGAVRVRRSPMR